MPGTMSVTGLASGLKTDAIMAKIMEFASRPKRKAEADKAEAQRKLTAWQDLNTRVLALKLKCDAIAEAAGFGMMQVTTSNKDIVTATASVTAIPGDYYITVTQRAQAHQVSSQSGAYASANDIVGTGTVTVTLNNGQSFQVTLDSNNNTLGALRDAINRADKGVSASIVNAGTSSSPDYRLLLTSKSTGVDAGMSSIVVELAGGTAPNFNLASPVQQALNARLEIGGGEGATPIRIEKSSNTIIDVIPGVTLNIVSADPSKIAKIAVIRNLDGIKSSISGFVEMYNSLVDAVKAQTSYDTETGESGLLLGDYQLQSIMMEIESALGGAVEGLSTRFKSLAEVGITTNIGGHLVINDAELTTALENHAYDVARLFNTGLDSGSAYVTYLSSTPETRPSGGASWTVSITQAARRGQVTAGAQMSAALDADEALTVNGVGILLTSGMNIDDVIKRINSYSSQTNIIALKTGADGTGTGNYITFRRIQYGSAYDVSVVSNRSRGAGNTSGVGNVVATTKNPGGEDDLGQGMIGLDVAGTINGETATGTGQILRLDSRTGTNAAKGLSLLITASSVIDPVTVKFTKGIGASLRDLLVNMTSSTGAITTAQKGVNDYIDDLNSRIADLESRLADQEERLYNQFNTMEAQLAKLQAQSKYLTAQLEAMNKKS